jgi:myo-inositol-1(or 4)-monophosphatase
MSLKHITYQVSEIAIKVGDFIKEECKKFNQNAIEVKSKNSLVSYVDKTAEKRIVEFLEILLPEAGFIAEEGTSDKKGEHYNWIIDPLDGTTNFMHGLPTYCVSIALQLDNEIVLGVVYEPNNQECFSAWKGGGAFLNNKPINVSPTAKVKDSLFATGFPYYDYDKLNGYMETLKWLMHETRGIRRIGSAAVDLSYVACGRFEGFYEYSLNAWDVAAGALIVIEAGGVVTDFKGGSDYIFGREIIASNNFITEELQGKVMAAFEG